MKTHPYLRAYMAGITIPTILLIFGMTVFTIARYVYNVPVPLERFIVFPLAIVPNLWGIWNILYIFLKSHRRPPIGFHGAILACVQVSIAFGITRLINFEIPAFIANAFPFYFPIVIIVFYLAWKHAVGFFNALLGIE